MALTRPRGRRFIGATLFACIGAGACHSPTSDRVKVDSWLTCVECSDGELDTLKALATQLPGTLDTLREDLLHGPSAAQRTRLTQQLQTTYQRLSKHLPGTPGTDSLPLTQAEFVDRYLGNMVAIYQGRAALALGAIGGKPAREALDSALHLPPGSFPPGVLMRIHYARDSLIGP